MGGSNGYEAEYNYEKYAKLNDHSLAESWDYAKKLPWHEIVATQDLDGGVIQHIITHN